MSATPRDTIANFYSAYSVDHADAEDSDDTTLAYMQQPSIVLSSAPAPRPSDTTWQPPPRLDPSTHPDPSPHSRSPGLSHQTSSGRLRQVSHQLTIHSLAGEVHGDAEPLSTNPFDDHAWQPSPYRAAMMDGGDSRTPSVSDHGGYDDGAAARGMRGDRAEWLPTPQHLYADSNHSHDDAHRVLGSQGLLSKKSSTSSMHGKASRARYDLTAISSDVLHAYEKSRYTQEADDALHDPGPKAEREGLDHRITEVSGFGGRSVSAIGWLNLVAIFLLVASLLMVFAGYPVLQYFTKNTLSNFGAVGMGGTNASGQVPLIPGYRGLIDADTPNNVLSRTGFDGRQYQLVFSDEFNLDGRTFYAGDDPYFEAVDLHYQATNNLEWYDPANVITANGSLQISLTRETLEESHNLGFLGGMLQSWNKFCFTGGYVEVAVSLPGDNKIQGLWPAVWTMGNLGRAGYGGSLEGNWPYAYDVCDIGTLANQTDPTTGGPTFPASMGDPYNLGDLSYLPGQRLSACTCPGENHPGPILSDGSFPGRSAPEIDIFEATVLSGRKGGEISQSAQWAPFNPGYTYLNATTEEVTFFANDFGTLPNTYTGGVFQQVTSALSSTIASTYNSLTRFQTYGFEYTPTYINGFGTGQITWTQGGEQMWKISDTAMAANTAAHVGNREVTGEPLYLLMNLGMSKNFGFVDLPNLVFPAVMRIDYVRVYQPSDAVNVGCDTARYPTKDYIRNNLAEYSNPNITVLADIGKKFPKNRLIDTC